ncbi:MAG: hypothetical protein GY760_00915 [Deltaproteobacteria bacterium]|nr:hypothetical protein [Deltaproteobacteria bacterium]
MKEKIGIKGSMYAKHTKPNGDVFEYRKDNLILDTGFDFICDALGKTADRPEALSFIALGIDDSTVSNDQTSLVNETGRVLATYSHMSGTKSFALTSSFSAGVATGLIKEAGVCNNSVNGVFIDRVVLLPENQINKEVDDILSITFTFTFQEG